jgi:hypothetical protein
MAPTPTDPPPPVFPAVAVLALPGPPGLPPLLAPVQALPQRREPQGLPSAAQPPLVFLRRLVAEVSWSLSPLTPGPLPEPG